MQWRRVCGGQSHRFDPVVHCRRVGDIIVGILGAFIGGYILRALGATLGGGLIGSIIVAFIGAVLLLFIVSLFTGRRGGRRLWS